MRPLEKPHKTIIDIKIERFENHQELLEYNKQLEEKNKKIDELEKQLKKKRE